MPRIRREFVDHDVATVSRERRDFRRISRQRRHPRPEPDRFARNRPADITGAQHDEVFSKKNSRCKISHLR